MYTPSPAPPRAAPSPPATSHQSGTIKEHWNDLPASMVSRSCTPICPDIDTATDAEFLAVLETLFGATTTLAPRERGLLHARVLKHLPAITRAQKREVAHIVRRLLRERSLSGRAARDAVVAFIMREPGVAGWAGGVRRAVECVVLE